MNNSDSLFPLEPIVRKRGAYMVRNLRLVADVVCEAQAEKTEDPAAIVAYMADVWSQFPEQEQAWVILLNAAHRPVGRQLVSVGTMSQTIVAPREVFRAAIVGGARALVLLHNHPSGDPQPSCADVAITRKLRSASELLDICLLDHVIVGTPQADPVGLGYYSFRRGGLL